MGQLYGCWLNSNFDFSHLKEKSEVAHKEYYPFYIRRMDAICSIAEIFVDRLYIKYPSFKGKLAISYTSAMAAIGRYINDIMHYKLWHDVKIANKAKMIAHTIKWLSHYNVVCATATAEDYASFSEAERRVLLEINSAFIGVVIRYFLSYFCDGDIPSAKSYEKIFYLIETGQYDAKTAAVAFEGIIV
jgi:hypothetical protein